MRRCSAEQSSALLEFKSYFSLSPPALSCRRPPPTESWKEGTDCCSLWDGITCDNETGQVVGIDLSCSGLEGNIPPNTTVFHHFPHLQELYLVHNYFGSSRIPSSFGHLSRLTDLDLGMSGFSGEIPKELSYLTQLMHLYLDDNYGLRFKKTGFQLLVQNLTKIRDLHLSSINISSAVPISLLNLTSSITLVLDGCELHGQLPDGVFNLPYLEKLFVGDNSLLTGNFPKFINSSNSLRILELEFTSFPGQLPDSIGNLGSLEWLHAAQCNIYGAIPASLGNLTSVQDIDLSNNNLSGPFPSQLMGLPNLQSLALIDNYITGPFPSRFTGLPNLGSLTLSYNHITGTISPGLFALSTLNALQLSYMISTASLSHRLGGLYCLCCLYEVQPFKPPVKIYLSLANDALLPISDQTETTEIYESVLLLRIRLKYLKYFSAKLDGIRNWNAQKDTFYQQTGVKRHAGEVPQLLQGNELFKQKKDGGNIEREETEHFEQQYDEHFELLEDDEKFGEELERQQVPSSSGQNNGLTA
ncbi:receptor-like protein Cf-9 [Diospyros lotus]|uniref:receptor-like protein Cf-9 n=1 Tax=Diospyros lotus TaxID=55363 RepID=UPI002255F5D8|nr:receptor-like protein Cf-9 [Diospyros lotus]